MTVTWAQAVKARRDRLKWRALVERWMQETQDVNVLRAKLEDYIAAEESVEKATGRWVDPRLGAFWRGMDQFHAALAKRDAAGYVKALDKALLAGVKIRQVVPLNENGLKRMLMMRTAWACDHEDAAFFVKLGRAMKQRRDPAPDRLRMLILKGWTEDERREVGFRHFSDEAMAAYSRIALGNKRITLDQVRKMRQRLELKKAKKPLVTRVEYKDGKIVVS